MLEGDRTTIRSHLAIATVPVVSTQSIGRPDAATKPETRGKISTTVGSVGEAPKSCSSTARCPSRASDAYSISTSSSPAVHRNRKCPTRRSCMPSVALRAPGRASASHATASAGRPPGGTCARCAAAAA